ncbi:MAG: SCO family protein [Chromatiales bacterium]|jgi:protein SCO1/2
MNDTSTFKRLRLNAILSSALLVCVTSAFASNGISALYEKYSPAKQFPLNEVCHTPAGGLPQISSSGGAVVSKGNVGNNGYVLTEHRFSTPTYPVVTMDGEKKSLVEVLNTDQPIMLNFIFTSCTTICPVLTATFTQLQEMLSEQNQQVKMISISIDPEYDTPEKLQDYARRFNAGSNWQFLTGEAADIIAIEKIFDAYRGAKMSHEPLTYIKANGSAPWVRLEGIASADDIMKEYKRLVSD